MELQIDVDRVLVENRWWRFSQRVLQARRIGDRIIVIFDYTAYESGKPAMNLAAYDLHQNQMWTAESPWLSTDGYVSFVSEEPLVIYNFSCFLCTLDPTSGKLLASEFTK